MPSTWHPPSPALRPTATRRIARRPPPGAASPKIVPLSSFSCSLSLVSTRMSAHMFACAARQHHCAFLASPAGENISFPLEAPSRHIVRICAKSLGLGLALPIESGLAESGRRTRASLTGIVSSFPLAVMPAAAASAIFLRRHAVCRQVPSAFDRSQRLFVVNGNPAPAKRAT